MADARSGEYSLKRSEYGGGEVYRNGARIGIYWPDTYGGYAVFRTGRATPIARRKTESRVHPEAHRRRLGRETVTAW